MAELETQRNKSSVKAFIDAVENEQRRKDARVVMKMMKGITGKRPEMWGTSIVGYGTYRYTYASGREVLYELIERSVEHMRAKCPEK